MKMRLNRSGHERRIVCVMSAAVESNISRRAAGRPAGLSTECTAGAGFLANYTKRSCQVQHLDAAHADRPQQPMARLLDDVTTSASCRRYLGLYRSDGRPLALNIESNSSTLQIAGKKWTCCTQGGVGTRGQMGRKSKRIASARVDVVGRVRIFGHRLCESLHV